MSYSAEQCAAVGLVPNADGSQCVPTDAETDAWWSDPELWAMIRAAESSSGGPVDPMSMILALIAAGQSPGSIDPAVTIDLCPAGTYWTPPTTPGGPPVCQPIQAQNAYPTWLLPAGLALVAVLVLKR